MKEILSLLQINRLRKKKYKRHYLKNSLNIIFYNILNVKKLK